MSAQPFTPTASTLIEQIRRDLDPLMKKIMSHRYLDALEQKKVPEDALKILASQQYRIVTNGIRNIALIVSRYGDLPSRTILNDFLQAEFAVREAVQKFAKAVGLTEEELERAPVLAEALMFSYFETFICLYGCDADLIMAFFFDAQVWISNARRVSRALQTHYGLSQEAVTFFDMYANYQASEEAVLPPVQAALDRGVPAFQIQEATRLLLEYELKFWDAMAEAAGV